MTGFSKLRVEISHRSIHMHIRDIPADLSGGILFTHVMLLLWNLLHKKCTNPLKNIAYSLGVLRFTLLSEYCCGHLTRTYQTTDHIWSFWIGQNIRPRTLSSSEKIYSFRKNKVQVKGG